MRNHSEVLNETRQLLVKKTLSFRGTFNLPDSFQKTVLVIRKQLATFLQGLCGERKLSDNEYDQVEAYTNTVTDIVTDVCKVQIRASKNRIVTEQIIDWPIKDILAFSWEISTQLQYMNGWFLSKKDDVVNANAMKKAKVPLRYHAPEYFKNMVQNAEFVELQESPSIFKDAAISNVSDPQGFLRKVLKTIEELKVDPEFKEFHDTPGIFKRAAVSNVSDLKDFYERY